MESNPLLTLTQVPDHKLAFFLSFFPIRQFYTIIVKNMSQRRFFPTDKHLEERPHLRAHLLWLEKLQQQHFRDHPEDQDEVRFFEVGHLGRPLVAEFSESFVEIDLERRRKSCWNQFVSNKKAENLLIRNPEHQSLIKAQYDDVKANEQDFQELIKQTDEFNAQAALVSVPEYKTHIVLFFSTEAKELVKRVGSYHNSAFGETSPASATAAFITNSSVAPTTFASTSASSVSDILSFVDSYKTTTEKRKHLQKYIRDEVLKLYQQRYSYEVKSVPWSLLLGSDSIIKLHPWTRVSVDLIDNRYRPQCLDLEILRELASNLHKGIVKILNKN
ncbi:hypothetical protein EDC96DRAFT_588997 [Choanephora cucurbitarum]|nr:hypothetical protein EDC96DRAFT_588997 [Choanephora cucurbitarum]